MATITTSTLATTTAYSSQRKIDRCQNGVLWTVEATATATTTPFTASYSTDGGNTWTSAGTLPAVTGTATTYTADGDLFIDLDDYAHWAYKDPNNGSLYYTRGTPTSTARTAWTWSTPTVVDNANYDYPSIVAHRDPATSGAWVAHIVYTFSGSTSTNKCMYARINIASGGALSVSASNGLSATMAAANTSAGFPSIDFRHTGDAKTVAGSTPDLYVGWSAGAVGTGYGLRFRKAAYSAGSWTWGTEVSVDTAHCSANNGAIVLSCFDGTRIVMAGQAQAGNDQDLILHDIDPSSLAVTTRTLDTALTATNPTRALSYGSAGYDAAGNVYLFGTTFSGAPTSLGYRVWTRSGATLGARVTITSSANAAPNLSARRGPTGNRIDYVYTNGTASPYTVTSGSVVLDNPPNAPTLTSPASGGSLDLTNPVVAWQFSDPDAGDSQSKFDLQYRLQGATAWTTVTQSTPTTSYTFTAGTLTAGSTYEWQVRTYDSIGTVGPWSSSSFFLAANPPTAPTITAPTTGATVPAQVTVTWSEPNQAAYQVRRLADDGAGNPVTSTVYFDTGPVTDTTSRAYTLTFTVNARTEHVQVRVAYQGLWSTWSDVKVLVAFTPPAAPALSLIPNQAGASLGVTYSQPAPGSGQPAVASVDIYLNHGDGVGLARRATGLPAAGTWTYYTPVSGRDYSGGNVAVVAVATTGATTTTTS